MKQFDAFGFEQADLDEDGLLELKYALRGDEEVNFTETVQFPASDIREQHPQETDALLTLAHLLGGTSYYKTCLPEKIDSGPHALSEDQAAFFSTVYEQGLMEFFYQNKLEPKKIPFPITRNPQLINRNPQPATRKLLIPIGGGKDSLVTAILAKEAGFDCTLFRMNNHPLIEAQAHALKLPLVTISRTLDAKLFDLNSQGALNGHIPITAYLSSLALLTALATRCNAVVISNERSSSEGNTMIDGKEVNHQWSKSLEFERMLQQYLADHMSTNLHYFSALRPLSELQIAQKLAKYPELLRLATSCNQNWKLSGEKPENKWCGTCPKCAFSFALFAAFVPPEELTKIFGSNLFEDEALFPLYRELLGIAGIKPFECVGTPSEAKAAFLLAGKNGYENTIAYKLFAEEALPTIENPDALIQECLTSSDDHAIPKEYQSILATL